MPTTTPIPTPTGWPNVRMTYHPLRDKLEEGRSLAVATTTMMAATTYWLQRLNANLNNVTNGTPVPAIPVPAGWPNIRSTYDASIEAKLASAYAEGASKTAQIEAIDYWIGRMQQDQSCVATNQPFVVYPYPLREVACTRFGGAADVAIAESPPQALRESALRNERTAYVLGSPPPGKMVVPFVRGSRILRALVLTVWIASLMAWLYVTLRIIVTHVDPPQPFLPWIRSFSFLEAGAFAFGLFCVSMFLYLWLWGRFRDMPWPSSGPPEWPR